jgi:membrane protein
LGKTLIALYLGRSALVSAYGAAASLTVVLLWVYYSAQIFLFGAELTWVVAERRASLPHQIEPIRDPLVVPPAQKA